MGMASERQGKESHSDVILVTQQIRRNFPGRAILPDRGVQRTEGTKQRLAGRKSTADVRSRRAGTGTSAADERFQRSLVADN